MGRGKKIVDTRVVVDAAVALIEARGYEEFSTRRLAAKLRISAMTLYNYYENREAILRDVVLRALSIFREGLPEKIEACHGADGYPLRAYMALAEHLLDFALARPNLYRFLFWADLGATTRREGSGLGSREFFSSLVRKEGDRKELESIEDNAYLFEVLINALAMNVVASGSTLSAERYRDLAATGYALLLGCREKMVRAS